MKKAKIILSAIALLALIGGALAFKSTSRYNQVTFYTLTDKLTIGDRIYTAPNVFCTAVVTATTASGVLGTYHPGYTTIAGNVTLTSSPFTTTIKAWTCTGATFTARLGDE